MIILITTVQIKHYANYYNDNKNARLNYYDIKVIIMLMTLLWL